MAVNRETATNRHFDLITIEMIVHSRERQVKSDQRCLHLQKNGETKGICVANSVRWMAAWKSGHPFLFDTAIESDICSKIFTILPKNNMHSDSFDAKPVFVVTKR